MVRSYPRAKTNLVPKADLSFCALNAKHSWLILAFLIICLGTERLSSDKRPDSWPYQSAIAFTPVGLLLITLVKARVKPQYSIPLLTLFLRPRKIQISF